MNSVEVFDLVERIAATSSKSAKIALLQSVAADEFLQDVLCFCYNPFKTYGIADLPHKFGNGNKAFDAHTWSVLDRLIRRDLTGNAARQAISVELDALDDKSAELFRRIIRKDMRAGFSESTCNKVWKGLIPEFSYMRCSLPKDVDLESWDWGRGVFSQEKADGIFMNLDYEASEVSLRTRQGTPIPLAPFATLIEQVRSGFVQCTQTHGECLVVKAGKVLPREIGNGILNHVMDGGSFAEDERPLFLAWDQIPLGSAVKKGCCNTPYVRRFSALLAQLKTIRMQHERLSIDIIPTKVVKSLAEAYLDSARLMKMGKEGSVIKNSMAVWRDGTSKDQVKLKLEFDCDLEVIAIEPGRVGTKNEGRAGALLCQTKDGKLQVSVAVKNEKMRDHVDANSDEWVGSIVPVVANDIMLPSESNDLHSLFLPRLLEANYRKDKTVADSLERVFAAKEAAILGQALKEAA